MKKHLLLLALISPAVLFGQKNVNDSNYVFGVKPASCRKAIFQIKVANISSTYGFGQFGSDYNLTGAFDFGRSKNFKKRIRNYFIKSASWLDTSYNTTVSLTYQQTLFDLAEVYIRQFRKGIYQNRRKIIWGTFDVDELNSQMLTNFSNRRVQYDIGTDFGTISNKQKEWEALIAKELDELEDFSAE